MISREHTENQDLVYFRHIRVSVQETEFELAQAQALIW